MPKILIKNKEIERKTCRSCNSKNLLSILFLGNQYVSNFVGDDFVHKESHKVPLELVLCDSNFGGCGLLQLKHTASRELLYKQYWFRSGLNETMKKALADVVTNAKRIVKLHPDNLVLDIGCNDGTLLRSYKNEVRKIGFEPAKNLVKEAKVGTTKIINDFFSYKIFNKNFHSSKCKIITSIAMFYDLEDPNSFVHDVARCLDKEGIWIIQMAYLVPMLNLNAFDNIGHEHLEYYSLKSLKMLLEKHKLEIFKVELNEVYGGSIRTYIKHKENKSISKSKSVSNFENQEKMIGLENKKVYDDFSKRVFEIKNQLNNFIKEEVSNGKKIYAYGASTKGNTLLQYCNLNSKIIKKAVDRDPLKWGKRTVGTKIPIISEKQARVDRPDYFLILPWHLVNYFKKREKTFLASGGKFIVPLPQVKLISINKETII